MELKRTDRARVLTEMVLNLSPRRPRSQVNLKFGHFASYSSCTGTARKCTKKGDARAELFFFIKVARSDF